MMTAQTDPLETKTSLRVNVTTLNALMNLAGELVLSRNQLLQGLQTADLRSAEASGQRIDMITSELQEAIMQTRMQPIASILKQCRTKAADLARQSGKKIELTVEGEDVELDNTILDAMADPLLQVIQNCVTHGIESPEERQAKNKEALGHIQVRIYHEAGKVNISISDDGCGVDPDTVAQHAVSRQLVSPEQVDELTEKQKMAFFLNPDFSMAAETGDDPDGVRGLELTAGNVETLGGRIELSASPGKGFRVQIKLPLTLAIIPSQITIVGQERYAIPQVNLDELVRIPAADVKNTIEKVGDAEVMRLRGELLPVLDLAAILGLEKAYRDKKNPGQRERDRRKNIADRRSKQHLPQPENRDSDSGVPEELLKTRSEQDRRQSHTSAMNIAVVSSGEMKYGLIVDHLEDSEEIVVKPVGMHIKDCRAFSGATIMGDGKVALILDIGNLALMADLSHVAESARSVCSQETGTETQSDESALLTFRNGDTEHFAAPLNLVERIERIATADIETVGKNRVIQYRGGALPLFELSMAGSFDSLPERPFQEMIVFRVGQKEVGLMVTPPLDIVESVIKIDDSSLKQPGIEGSMTINNHTTLIIDIFELVESLSDSGR